MTQRVVFIGLWLAVLPGLRLPAQDGILRYVETHGQRSYIMEYGVTRSAEGIDVTSVGGGLANRLHWVPGTGTVAWQQTDAAAGTDIRAERTNDTIRVNGRLKGKEVTREIHIDAAPWYQVFGPIIGELLPTGSDRREFWVLNPNDLAAHKMLARRAGSERIEINGALIDTFKIHFSPAGALAPFWGADFWYRPSDAAYLFSRLPENDALTITTIAGSGK